MKLMHASIVAAACGMLGACAATPDAPMQRRLAVDGTTLPYVDQGRGVPVVLVHAALGDHRAWEPLRATVVSRYRYLTFDQRYFGASPWPDNGERFGPLTQANDLAAFVRGLRAGPVHLVGWSMSGASVLTVALQHPELVRSVFVYEPGLLGAVEDPDTLRTLGEDRHRAFAPALALTKAGDHAAATKALINGVNDQADAFDNGITPAYRAMVLENARTLAPMFAASPSTLRCHTLRQITAPVMVVHGEDSRSFYRQTAEATARCIPGARLAVVPQARHLWPTQQPAAFAQTLLGFLDGLPAGVER